MRIFVKAGKYGLFPNFSEMMAFRSVLMHLVKRDFLVRYKQTALSYAWLIIQPLGLMILMTIFFSRIARIQSEGLPYPIFMLSGFVTFRLFATGVATGSGSLNRASGLLKQIYVPRIFFPLSGVAGGLIQGIGALFVLLVLLVYFSIEITWRAWLIPIFFCYAALVAFSFSIVFSTLNIVFRDIGQAIPVIIQAMFYACPIVYPIGFLPPEFLKYYVFNPMVGTVLAFRWCINPFEGFPVYAFVVSASVTLTLLILGLIIFNRAEKTATDYM